MWYAAVPIPTNSHTEPGNDTRAPLVMWLLSLRRLERRFRSWGVTHRESVEQVCEHLSGQRALSPAHEGAQGLPEDSGDAIHVHVTHDARLHTHKPPPGIRLFHSRHFDMTREEKKVHRKSHHIWRTKCRGKWLWGMQAVHDCPKLRIYSHRFFWGGGKFMTSFSKLKLKKKIFNVAPKLSTPKQWIHTKNNQDL